MQKLKILIVFVLTIIFVVGCTGAKMENQSTKIGTLLLNPEKITTIKVSSKDGPKFEWSEFVTLNNLSDISLLISKIKAIPVKRLTKQEDIDFMKKRIVEEGLLEIELIGEDDSFDSLQGMLMIWSDGSIYTVNIESMNSNQRTISYLSELKYPEIYKWLTDKAKQRK